MRIHPDTWLPRRREPRAARGQVPARAGARGSTRAAAAAALVVLTAAAVGCGGGGGGGDDTEAAQNAGVATTDATSPAPTSTTSTKQAAATPPRPLEACRSAGSGWRRLPTPGRSGAVAASMGDGRLGVVFANDSIDDACEWSREARALARRGYAVAVFQTGGGEESRQAIAVGEALGGRGARRIVLIGASVGARAVIEAGAQHPPDVVGLVALPAERRIGSNPSDLLPVGRRVRVPVLSIGSRGDPLTNFGKDTVAWDRTIPDDEMLLLGGARHGAELLAGRHGPRVRGEIASFLNALGWLPGTRTGPARRTARPDPTP